MKKIPAVLTSILFFLMLYINSLSGSGKINNIGTGEVSAMFPTMFTPAGYTFAIWGLIYLANLVFIIYILWKSFSGRDNNPTARVVLLHGLSSVFNMAWIFAWHYQLIGLSEALMISLLVVLILLYRDLTAVPRRNILEHMFMVVPVSLYLSWIVVATVANTAIFLSSLLWNGFGLPAHVWASIMIVVAAALNLMVLLDKKDIFFSLVFLWAAMGIISARRMEGSEASGQVAITAFICMIVVFAGILFVRFFYIKRENIGSE